MPPVLLAGAGSRQEGAAAAAVAATGLSSNHLIALAPLAAATIGGNRDRSLMAQASIAPATEPASHGVLPPTAGMTASTAGRKASTAGMVAPKAGMTASTADMIVSTAGSIGPLMAESAGGSEAEGAAMWSVLSRELRGAPILKPFSATAGAGRFPSGYSYARKLFENCV